MAPSPNAQPIVIGHRGACGYRPEHTLESYRLAAEQGADFIEPDLVITRDGVLVARHENEIGSSTDVAGRPEFAGRRTTKVVDGTPFTGWFAEDFTLAEIKTLRAKERLPHLRPANTAYDGRFEVPTFEEILYLRERLCEEHGRTIGVYPETKHPAYFAEIGLPLEAPLVRALEGAGLNRRDAPVFVQSFGTNLPALRETLHAPAIQLVGITSPERATREALAEIARFADGVGPNKALVTEAFVADAHDFGLLVHPYTFRRENSFLPNELRSSDDPAGIGNLAAELHRFLALGVDGVFTDNPDIAVAGR